jgi:hypothetical protein
MKAKTTGRFWKLYHQLPAHIQRLAVKNYHLWLANPRHPSLDFKPLRGGDGRFSVRVGDHYRALGRGTEGGVEWVWIGTHEDYNKLLNR